jgi:hypothetical protein
VRLGPEISDISRRAREFQRDQMIFLEIAEVMIGVAVFSHLLSLQAFRVGLPGPCGSDAFRRGYSAAPAISLRRVWRDRKGLVCRHFNCS